MGETLSFWRRAMSHFSRSNDTDSQKALELIDALLHELPNMKNLHRNILASEMLDDAGAWPGSRKALLALRDDLVFGFEKTDISRHPLALDLLARSHAALFAQSFSSAHNLLVMIDARKGLPMRLWVGAARATCSSLRSPQLAHPLPLLESSALAFFGKAREAPSGSAEQSLLLGYAFACACSAEAQTSQKDILAFVLSLRDSGALADENSFDEHFLDAALMSPAPGARAARAALEAQALSGHLGAFPDTTPAQEGEEGKGRGRL